MSTIKPKGRPVRGVDIGADPDDRATGHVDTSDDDWLHDDMSDEGDVGEHDGGGQGEGEGDEGPAGKYRVVSPPPGAVFLTYNADDDATDDDDEGADGLFDLGDVDDGVEESGFEESEPDPDSDTDYDDGDDGGDNDGDNDVMPLIVPGQGGATLSSVGQLPLDTALWPSDGNLKVLVVCSNNPDKELELKPEGDLIKQMRDKADQHKFAIDIRVEVNPDRLAFVKTVEDFKPNWLHYAGHGSSSSIELRCPTGNLSKRVQLSVGDLAAILKRLERRLIGFVANCCQSSKLAARLVKLRAVACAVGVGADATDDTESHHFAKAFWLGMFRKQSARAAFSLAKNATPDSKHEWFARKKAKVMAALRTKEHRTIRLLEDQLQTSKEHTKQAQQAAQRAQVAVRRKGAESREKDRLIARTGAKRLDKDISLRITNGKGGSRAIAIRRSSYLPQLIMAVSQIVTGDRYFANAVRLTRNCGDTFEIQAIACQAGNLASANCRRVYEVMYLNDGESYTAEVVQYNDDGRVLRTRK
eukprot:m.483787 g.483787  ORF g.483787 m.483787 type:complete len:529 (+) comp23081_c0_seq1:292-1878(+)